MFSFFIHVIFEVLLKNRKVNDIRNRSRYPCKIKYIEFNFRDMIKLY